MKTQKAATARVDITPPTGTPIAGNVRKDNKSRGVHDPLYCNILILDDDTTRICMLGFDLIWLEERIYKELIQLVEEATGIPEKNIIVWATHTHSGPDTGLRMYGEPSGVLCDYLDDMKRNVVEGVKRAASAFQEVILKVGKREVEGLSFNRRLVKKDGSVVMNFEEFDVDDITGTTGPVDKELLTFSVWDKSNNLVAVLVNFSLHPAILVGYQWLISRDYINYLDRYILEKHDSDVVVLFANGAEGNINHLNYQDPDQGRNFEEAERIGEKLGEYVEESLQDSSLLDGKIKFVSEKVTFPLREITIDERKWAEMVMERDKDLEEDQLDGIPDKTYARMIQEMSARKENVCETVLQGLAVNNFALVTFPGEVYVEFGLKVKELSPYPYTMVIGLANSHVGYIPAQEAFSQGGYEVRTAWTSQLTVDAGDILVNLVNRKILAGLLKQSVRVMERKASDNKYLHKDFHVSMNLLLTYIYDNFGRDALISYLQQFAREYHKPLIEQLRAGKTDALVSYLKGIYEKEEWPVEIMVRDTSVELTQSACPAISHIIEKGGKPSPYYRETYNTVYKTICEGTPFEYVLEYFDESTGACKQVFSKKEDNQ